MSLPNSTRLLAYKNLDEALRLDMANNVTGAFLQYLRSLSSLCSVLLENAHSGAFPKNNNESKKFLELARQCLERMELLDKECHNTWKDSSVSINKPQDGQQNKIYNEFSNSFLIKPQPTFNGSSEFSSLLNMPVSCLEEMPALYLNFVPEKQRKLSPLEMVQKENQQLMSAYKARLARTDNARAQTNLNLSLQRRMAENILLAQAKQKVYLQQSQERQERLLEQAARKIQKLSCTESEEDEGNKQLLAQIFEYEQDEKWPLRLKESLSANPKDYSLIDNIVKQTLKVPSHPLCQMKLKLQYHIYDALSALLNPSRHSSLKHDVSSERKGIQETVIDEKQSKCTINEKVDDPNFDPIGFPVPLNSANNTIESECFSCNERIVREEIQSDILCAPDINKNECENHFERKENPRTKDSQTGVQTESNIKVMEAEALKRHLHNIVLDVRSAMNKLVTLLVLTYDHLNSPEGRDQCYASIEEPFFTPLWSQLITLFRLVYKNEEAVMANVMTNLNSITLTELGVPENYWKDKADPYQEAITEIKNIVTYSEPLKKLELLVHVARLVCENTSKTAASIGADDLLPMLCFVVIKSRLPELVSECYAMEQFIHEGYLMGEEGYCLTSMKTVFQYLATRSQELDVNVN